MAQVSRQFWQANPETRRVRRLILELYFENRQRSPAEIARLLDKRYGIKRDRTAVWRILVGNGLNNSQRGRPKGRRQKKRRQQKRTRRRKKRATQGPAVTKAERQQRRQRRRKRRLRQRLQLEAIFTKLGGLLLNVPLIVHSHLPQILAGVKQDLNKALLLLNHLLQEGGYLADVNEENDPGLPVSSGLDDIKDASELHRFLEQINADMLAQLQLAFGRRMKQLGAFKGQGVNVDGHFIPYYGQLNIPKGRHGTKKRMEKGFYLWVVCDHHTNNLIYFKVTLCDVKETKILADLLSGAEQIVGQNTIEWYCVDRGFYEIGIISGLGGDRQAFIPAKHTGNVIRAMAKVGTDQFKPYHKGKRVAETRVEIAGRSIRLIVLAVTTKKGQTRRFGFLTSDQTLAASKVIKRYSRRWRVENWLKAGKLDLNLDNLPGLSVVYDQDGHIIFKRLVDKLAAYIFFKSVASHLTAWLNRLVGHNYRLKTWRKRFFHQNALWQADAGRLVVRFQHRFQGQVEFQRLWQTIQQQNVPTTIPWLNNLQIHFVFQPT